jgi:hypothetical protein
LLNSCFILWYWCPKFNMDQINGVIVSVVAMSVKDQGFNPWSDQNKYFGIDCSYMTLSYFSMEIFFQPIYITVKKSIKSVYNGHWRESENVHFMSSCSLNTGSNHICTIHIIEKVKLLFTDSDLWYTCTGVL